MSTATRSSCSALRASSFRWCAGSASTPCSAISAPARSWVRSASARSSANSRCSTGSPSSTPGNVAGIAELGVVFLLFLIGMELSYERLKAMRRLVFGLGSLQIVFRRRRSALLAVLAGSKAPVAADPRRVPRPVLDRHRHRDAVQPGRLTTAAGRTSFRGPAGAGPGRRAAAAVRLDPGRRRFRFGDRRRWRWRSPTPRSRSR